MTFKSCSKCRLRLHISFFYARADRPGKFTSHCRDCIAATVAERKEQYAPSRKAYYTANKVEIARKNKDYQSRNPDKVKVWAKRKTERLIAKDPEAYYRATLEKYYANREYHAVKRKERRERFKIEEEANRTRWRKANMGVWASYNQKYRSRKVNATPAWVDHDEIMAIYEVAAWLTEHSGEPHEVDHIVPLTSDRVCGLHCAANLQILTASENRSKGNRYWPGMW